MASHDIPRKEPTGPKSSEARKKELQEIDRYRALVDQMTKGKNDEIYDEDALQLTSRILKENPEYYSVWNYRRQILEQIINNVDATRLHSGIRDRIVADMDFLMPLLIKFPKCYWIWNHRSWLLQQTSTHLTPSVSMEFWRNELALVEKMHSRDSRNFLAWNYRRKVISEQRKLNDQMQEAKADNLDESSRHLNEHKKKSNLIITENEFSNTTKMIQSNLSNFSAWHNRSQLIPRLLNERDSTAEKRRSLFEDDLQLIEDAVLMDPADQSLWYYHEFLMEQLNPQNECTFVQFDNADRCKYLEDQIQKIREVLDDTDDCKWIYLHLLQYASTYLEIEVGNKLFTTQDMRAWLSKLRELDPLRKARWDDMELHKRAFFGTHTADFVPEISLVTKCYECWATKDRALVK